MKGDFDAMPLDLSWISPSLRQPDLSPLLVKFDQEDNCTVPPSKDVTSNIYLSQCLFVIPKKVEFFDTYIIIPPAASALNFGPKLSELMEELLLFRLCYWAVHKELDPTTGLADCELSCGYRLRRILRRYAAGDGYQRLSRTRTNWFTASFAAAPRSPKTSIHPEWAELEGAGPNFVFISTH